MNADAIRHFLKENPEYAEVIADYFSTAKFSHAYTTKPGQSKMLRFTATAWVSEESGCPVILSHQVKWEA